MPELPEGKKGVAREDTDREKQRAKCKSLEELRDSQRLDTEKRERAKWKTLDEWETKACPETPHTTKKEGLHSSSLENAHNASYRMSYLIRSLDELLIWTSAIEQLWQSRSSALSRSSCSPFFCLSCTGHRWKVRLVSIHTNQRNIEALCWSSKLPACLSGMFSIFNQSRK